MVAMTAQAGAARRGGNGAGRRILFIHDHFPGQFGSLALFLRGRGWDVTFATRYPPMQSEGLRIVSYAPHRAPSAETHPYAQPMDRAALNGQAFVRSALALRAAGYRPDVIVAHSGWGAGLFARDVFPEAAFIAYAEWWYRHPGADIAFLAAQDPRWASLSREAPMVERARNAPIALDLAAADAAICPTHFQAGQFPPLLRRGLSIRHDGVDADFYAPGAPADPTLDGRVAAEAKVITYATRGMEPHRGFPQLMAALPEVLARHPDAVVLIAGTNRVSYGNKAIRSVDWKAQALAHHALDPRRVIFTGPLPRLAYRDLLRRSDAHIYLTVPFVLSWSMLEAMSTGAQLVLSDTPPVREFAGPDEAVLTQFQPEAIAQAIGEALTQPSVARRRAARARILEGPSLERELPLKERILADLLQHRH